MIPPELPLPPHFDPDKVGKVWRVPYQDIADAAVDWSRDHDIRSHASGGPRVCLVMVDV